MKTKEEHELEQMLIGAQREEENLRDYITEICSIIYMECPLEYQDEWLERMVALGYYKRTELEDI
tara:strand:+ start:89 stop:283 length:195 start_codon:yes stop_codon:yes gene_type:complete